MVIVIQCTVFIWIKCRKIKVSHFLLVLELLFSALFFYKNQMTKNCCLSFSIGFEIVIQCTLFIRNLITKNKSLPFSIGFRIVIQCTLFYKNRMTKNCSLSFSIDFEIVIQCTLFYKNRMTKNWSQSFFIGFKIVIQCTLIYMNLMTKTFSLPFLIGLNNCHSVHSFLRWWKILVSDFLFVLSLIVLSLIARFFCKNWTERKNEVSSICLELSLRAQILKRRKSSIS